MPEAMVKPEITGIYKIMKFPELEMVFESSFISESMGGVIADTVHKLRTTEKTSVERELVCKASRAVEIMIIESIPKSIFIGS